MIESKEEFIDGPEFVDPEFDLMSVTEALDATDPADPHQSQTNIVDRFTFPVVDAPLFNTFTALTKMPKEMKYSDAGIVNMPDASDVDSSIVDLDTAKDYVKFIQNTIKNIVISENEFSIP